ncbi:recombinase family protein [Kineococcus sp. G2]|uniref:recombinase family protein n=1 Tax=Kineococcus sp. G2 TaxID=3127484 RepID=UPI00301C556F
MRAVTYLRLSNHTEASTSITRQREETRARCEREGWSIVAELADPNVSGAKARANAAEALRMLRDDHADVLVVAAFDRWSRTGLGAVADLVEVLDERGRVGRPALFVTCRDGISSAMAGWRLTAVVIAEIARQERENTSARTAASLAKLTQENRWRGGTVPPGYRAEKNTDRPGYRLVVDEEKAALWRDAARRIVAGASAYSIVKSLNAAGVPSPTGTDWYVTAFSRTITSPRMVGRVIYRGDVVRDEEGLPATVWEPLLDVETWERVRVALGVDKPPAERKRRPKAARLLSGLLVCASCGANLHVNTSRQRPAYACGTRQRGGMACTAPVSVRADAVEEHVSEQFLAEFGDQEVYERVEVAPQRTDLAEVIRAIEVAAADLARAADLHKFERLQGLQERRAELEATPMGRRVELRPTGRTYAEVWTDEGVVGRRTLLAANYSRITVRPATKGGRWARVDDRLQWFSRPAFPAGALPVEDYTAGTWVVDDPED